MSGATTHGLLWDNHVCLPLRPDDPSFLPQLARHRRAGVSVVSINAGFGAVEFDETLRMLRAFRTWFAAHGDEYALVHSVADIDAARTAGRLGIVFDIEGGDCLGTDPERLLELEALGVRWMSIAYNRNNLLGGGCQDDDGGLTPLGAEVVAAMERAGIVVCLSHTGMRTALDALERATHPAIYSHSNPAACWRHRRNIEDEAIRRCAATGGVVGINGIGIFLGRNDASIDALTRHIDHVANLVGILHVGLGLDYIYDRAELDAYVVAHPDLYPPADGYGAGIAMMAPEKIPELADRLLARGYADDDLAALLGGNWLRIANLCWRG